MSKVLQKKAQTERKMTNFNNPFEHYSQITKPAWKARQERATQKRLETMKARGRAPLVKTALERALDERDNLSAAYRREQRQREEELLLSDYIGEELRDLMKFLRRMTLSDAGALVKRIEEANWLREAPADIRMEVLGIIGRAISRLRGKEGMPPFDDALWNEPLDAFTRIKQLIGEPS